MIIAAPDFDLHHTLASGQLFRYHSYGDGYLVHSRDRLFYAAQQKNKLMIKGVSRKFAVSFFGLGHDLSGIVKNISKDAHLKRAAAFAPGLRIMRQDPWECLVNFICSSCASIPKITKNVNQLAAAFGSRISFEEVTSFGFPDPGSLCSLARIKRAGTGFRSKYLHALNTLAAREGTGFLQDISKMDYPDALQSLTALNGVGEKVADCALLFSHGFFEAFPVDTWIKKGMQELYYNNREQKLSDIKAFGQQYFGSYAGYAQQYLFYWKRTPLGKV